jgi:hypothetical protein
LHIRVLGQTFTKTYKVHDRFLSFINVVIVVPPF